MSCCKAIQSLLCPAGDSSPAEKTTGLGLLQEGAFGWAGGCSWPGPEASRSLGLGQRHWGDTRLHFLEPWLLCRSLVEDAVELGRLACWGPHEEKWGVRARSSGERGVLGARGLQVGADAESLVVSPLPGSQVASLRLAAPEEGRRESP